MATIICKAKQKGIVKRRGKPTIEFYKDEKPQYYCMESNSMRMSIFMGEKLMTKVVMKYPQTHL